MIRNNTTDVRNLKVGLLFMCTKEDFQRFENILGKIPTRWPCCQALSVVNQGTKVQKLVSNTLPYQCSPWVQHPSKRKCHSCPRRIKAGLHHATYAAATPLGEQKLAF